MTHFIRGLLEWSFVYDFRVVPANCPERIYDLYLNAKRESGVYEILHSRREHRVIAFIGCSCVCVCVSVAKVEPTSSATFISMENYAKDKEEARGYLRTRREPKPL